MATTIEVNKQSVKQLLETGKAKPFIIPEYQRPYAWEDEQIETLFDDLWDFTSNGGGSENNSTYFLGSVVSYENENGEQEIIDGQQRITSLFLLLRAIYTKLKESDVPTKEAKNFISQIEPAIWRTNKLTGEVDYSNILLESKVMNNEGNEILKNILQAGVTSNEAKDNYSKNYNKFLELYENASAKDPLKIYEFIYTLLNQAILLPITADSQDTALTIFSTLNDRGLPLSDADIFKAKIYNKLTTEEEKKEFIDNWKELDEKAQYASESIQQLFYYYMFYLRALENDVKTTTPGLRKYYSANKFKQLEKGDLLTNLRIILNIWLVVTKKESIEEEPWSENNDIRQALDILSSYPNEFWKYPVVIYYLQYRKDVSFEVKFIKFLRKLVVELLTKYLVTPTINAVKADIMKLNAAVILANTPRFDFKEVNETELKKCIKDPHRNAVRMLLKIIAYDAQNELLPDKWEIEHIFPQKWQTNYFPNLSDEMIREKIENIGNKIPFEKRLNIVAGNGYFGKKKKAYQESKINITKELSNCGDDWNLDDISERNIRVTDKIGEILSDWNSNYKDIKDYFTDHKVPME